MKKLKLLIAVVMVLTLLFAFTSTCSAQQSTVVGYTEAYYQYIPLYGWWQVHGEVPVYITLNYNNGYRMIRAEYYDASSLGSRSTGTRYYYQTW